MEEAHTYLLRLQTHLLHPCEHLQLLQLPTHLQPHMRTELLARVPKLLLATLTPRLRVPAQSYIAASPGSPSLSVRRAGG